MQLTRLHHLLITLIVATLFITSIFSYIANSKAAFGTSPPWVKNDHMLPGTSFEQVINLSRSDTDKAVKANVQLTGDEQLIKWLNIENIDDLIMRKGQTTLPMKVTVNVPKKAELKNYRGGIFITLKAVDPDTLGGGQVGIALGANITVDITVIGDKVIDYRVISVLNNPIEEKNPLSIKVQVKNLGNVSINEVKGKVDIYDETQSVLIKSLDFLPLDDAIAPDETQIARMIFEDTILEPGDYWLFIEASKDGKVVYENRLKQQITKIITPIITPEDAMFGKESLPKLPGEGEAEAEEQETPEIIEIPVTELKPAASATNETNNAFLIFGLAGLGFGLIALIGVIIVLIFILKNQRQMPQQTVNGPYFTPNQTIAPPPAPSPPISVQPQLQVKEDNSGENGNIGTDADSQK